MKHAAVERLDPAVATGLALVERLIRLEIGRLRAAGVPAGQDEYRGLYISDEEVDQLLGAPAPSQDIASEARLDAQLSFPGQIKQVLTNLRVGSPDSIGDKEVQVVQGSGPKGLLATLYFDKQSGLLLRTVRYSTSPIGRIPTQLDYADYRDIGGIKFPFKYTFSWLDGRDSFQLSDVKVNVPIDAAKFDKP